MKPTNIKIKVYDLKTNKTFYLYFDTEEKKQKRINKLRFSKHLFILDRCMDDYSN